MAILSDLNAPELLSPAGDWEAMRSAVANGADAVYFGLPAFNARHRAANFSVEELGEIFRFLHGHNVRGYVALNVLIFSDELEEAVRYVRAVADAGADAVIVQDLGLARLIARMCPTMPVHGSTQMTLTEPLGIEFVAGLGVKRAILARELSLDEIRKIAAATAVPLEVFVHGALCISYSGQCLTSESLGGRSANRGQCAQACRLSYELIVDGQKRDLGDKAYLLSPQDLAAYDLVGELAAAGVGCLKIEGRLKSPHYVAATTQTYRAAIDSIINVTSKFELSEAGKHDLAQSFSRGFTHGFLDGVNHQELVHARFPKSRGVRIGRVTGTDREGIWVKLESAAGLKAGDGVVFDQGHPEQDEQGGRIVEVRPGERGSVRIGFYHGDVNLSAVEIGSIVWKTDDPEIRKRLEHSWSRDRVVRPVKMNVDVTVAIGQPLRILATDDQGHRVEVVWDRAVEAAMKHPLTREGFAKQWGRLGGTPFELGEVKVNGNAAAEFPGVMVPVSVLNDLRRQAAEKLAALRVVRHEVMTGVLEEMRREMPQEDLTAENAEKTKDFLFNNNPEFPPRSSVCSAVNIPFGEGKADRRLHVLVRTEQQLDAVLGWTGVDGIQRGMVYCEFEDVRRYGDAVKRARAAGAKIGLATLRIIKPHEHGFLKKLAEAEPDAILARNLAAVSFFAAYHPHLDLIGDYALNVANELTAAIFARAGLRRMTASYDLNWKQMAAMFQRISPLWFEAVIHQHMPMFHMEHCVFSHTLSNGKDFRDCGRPCEKHLVDLRDRETAGHPLVADAGCRNTVYNGTAQSAAEYVPRMAELGIADFRLELLRHDAAQTVQLLDQYGRVVAGRENGRKVWRELRVLNQLGVTRGTLE